MADESKRTLPPPRNRQPSRPSLDDSEADRLLAEARDREARLLAELEAERKAREAAQQSQRRAPPSVPPSSGGGPIKLQASGSARSFANLLLYLMAGGGLTLGAASLATKAETKTVENQAVTVAVTREDMNAATSRIAALERKDRRRDTLERLTMDHMIQVMADGKVAIMARPQGLSPMKPIETHWPRPLPGRNAVAPILIVDTPYPTLEWVSE